MDDNHNNAEKCQNPSSRDVAPSVTVTSPTYEIPPGAFSYGVIEEFERRYLEGRRDASSQSSIDSLGHEEDENDSGDYVYLLLKPPQRTEVLLIEDSDDSDDNSIGRSASVRSAPADIGTADGSHGAPDSPRLKRKAAIRRHSTFANRGSDNHRPVLSRADTATGQDLSRSADWRDKPARRSLLDVQEEYFTLNIVLRGSKQAVKCKVEQGTSLRYILSKVADEHSFELSSVDVFVESSQTPFPLDTPTYALARRNLHVRESLEKEPSSQISAPIKLTRAQRDSTSSLSSSLQSADHMAALAADVAALPDEFNSGRKKKDLSQFLGVNNPSSTPGKGNNRRSSVPGLMTPKSHEKFDPKSFALQEKLDQFSIHGLPPFPKLLSISDRGSNDDQEVFELEDTWRKIVKNVSSMDKKDQDQMEAIWEIFKTEHRCIKNLRIIIDLYMCTLLNLQASSLLNGIRTEKIFANIIEIERLHIQFWKEHIMRCLRKLRTERKPLSANDIFVAFRDFTSIFIPYFKFCPEEGHCLELVRSLAQEDSLFKQYLEWCEKRRECERKKLSDLLVYPMQRLTKYPLLISAVAKKTTDERMKTDVLARADEVDHFIRRINHEVTRHQEQCKLESALSKIEGYEGVNIPSGCEELTKLADDHANLDLSAKMPFAKAQQSRWLLYENPMKIRDQDGRYDVYVFLFTDAFVVTKPKKDKFKVIRPPLRIDKLYIQELKDRSGFAAVVVNDYGCASYGFVATTGTESLQKWMEKIAKAKELYNYSRTEDTDDFFDNISISQSSERTDTSSGVSVDVDTPTGSPTSSPIPSPKTPHRRVTTSMFEMSPPDIPGVLREEAEEEQPSLVALPEETEVETEVETVEVARPEEVEKEEDTELAELTELTEHDNNNEEVPLPPSPLTPITPSRRVPPVPLPRRVSDTDSKRVPPPVSPKPQHTIQHHYNNAGTTTLGVVDRTGRGDSFHNVKLEENRVKSIIAYDSDEDEAGPDDLAQNDPYINTDLNIGSGGSGGGGRFKKNASPTPPAKRGSPRRFRSPNRKDTCKVDDHKIMKQCQVGSSGDGQSIDSGGRKHGEDARNGSAAIISHC